MRLGDAAGGCCHELRGRSESPRRNKGNRIARFSSSSFVPHLISARAHLITYTHVHIYRSPRWSKRWLLLWQACALRTRRSSATPSNYFRRFICCFCVRECYWCIPAKGGSKLIRSLTHLRNVVNVYVCVCIYDCLSRSLSLCIYIHTHTHTYTHTNTHMLLHLSLSFSISLCFVQFSLCTNDQLFSWHAQAGRLWLK